MNDEIQITNELIALWDQDVDLVLNVPYRRMASQASQIAKEHFKSELARLRRVEAAAREVLGNAKDRTPELDRLAAALREAVQSTSSEAETEPK